jgi:mono/diheme cytochrome c family protein
MQTRGITTVRAVALSLSVGAMGLAALRSVAAPPVQTRGKKAVVKAPAKLPVFSRDVKALFAAECNSCHGKVSPSAGLNLTKFQTEAQAMSDLSTIEKAMGRVMAGEMPPGRKLPVSQRTALQNWVQGALSAQCRLADPGRVTLRRLNREEYNNTVQDLLGTKLRPADDFPGDDVGNGFDNMGDVLTISPLLMEKFMDSAEKLAKEAILVPHIFTRHFEGSDFVGGSIEGSSLLLFSTGVATKEVKLTAPGNYRVRVKARGQLAGDQPPKLEVSLDGKVLDTFTVSDTKARSFEVMANIPDGKHQVGVNFTNDYYNAQTKADRNLLIDSLELTGPMGAVTYPASHKRIVPFEPDKGQEEATARKFIYAFASRAFRRPATPQDLDRLMPVWQAGFKGGSFDEGMRNAVQACLSSPRFLFRLEQDPPGNKMAVRSLDSYEVASRLSYFLWSSMPDDELMGLAAKGQLIRPAVLRAQVKRMIASPRAQALANNFAGQWLQLRKLAIVEPDPARFPVTPELRQDMGTETKLFFLGILQNGRPITDFIDGKYSYLNARLADLYGITGVTGNEFRKVALSGDRGGVLTQASVLTVTSNPTRTSPTKRGKWVLENIFNTPPPPPPPGVSDIPDEAHKIEALTLRQLMEQHRKNPACAVCHQKMDPIGFGMENFDPIGRWRDKEGKFDVDASGTLPSGKSFRGPTQLKKILLEQKPLFARALSEKLLTYALGRAVESTDRCSLDAVAASGYRLDDLVTAVVTSDPFLKRKGNAK